METEIKIEKEHAVMIDAALILEGGGMRGVYTAGVLDFFLDRGIKIKNTYGVSAGACHACSYLSGQRGRALRTAIDYLDDPAYAGFRTLMRTRNFFGVDMIYKRIPDELIPFDHDAYERSGQRLTAVLTNCLTGEAEYFPIEDLRKDIIAIQASSSLPLLSQMVEIGSEKYLDGGVGDSIPIARSIKDGNQLNIVILTRHRGYRKNKNGAMALMKARYHKYPNLIKSIEERHLKYNEALDLLYEEERQGRAYVIQPEEPVKIGRLEKDREKLKALYDLGCRDAEKQYVKLGAFLEQNL